jgi:putative heme-binding domain-containing protein
MHALYALDGLGSLKEAQVLTALNDADAIVREHAIKLSEKFKGAASDKLWTSLRQLADDPVSTVRYQLAFTLGEFDRPGRIAALAAIAARDLDSPWTRAAILSSLSDGAGEMFALLAANTSVCDSKPGQDFLRELVSLVGAMNRPAEVGQVLEFIGKVNELGLRFALVGALGDGLHRAGSSLGRDGRVGEVFVSAAIVAADPQVAEPVRVQAIQLLGLTSYAESSSRLLSLLDLQQPQAVQLAAIATLARFTDPQVGPELTKRWGTLTPRLRSETLAALLARAERAHALLEAIAAGTIQPSVLDSMQTKFLANHRNKEVRELAAKVLAAQPASTRQQVIDAFTPALNLKGDPARGKKIYVERCISCHRLGGQGFVLGPDLVTVKSTGKEKMLVNILDPNREVRPDFASYLVETKDDESYIGLVVNETGAAVTLRQAYGKEDVIRRANIRKMQSSSQSLMPEGLEAGLTPQDVSDLLEYIETAEAK